MGEQDHRSTIKALEAHNPPGSGCVVRCESAYKEGNTHSHRWQAAEQARAEKDVYKVDTQSPWRIVGWGMDKLDALRGEGALSGGISQDAQGRNTASLKPFYRAFIPFPHNAHHVVPMGVLWAEVIDTVVAKAKEDPGTMFNLVVGGFLTEPYNHNDRPNMITLPTRNRESQRLGLPMHLEEGARSHPKYSMIVAAQVKVKIPPKYDALANELNQKKHAKNETTVEVKQILVKISEATYKAIMSIARAQAGANQTLDRMSREIAAGMNANLAR